jgi:tRNA(adenine34) deaminase
MYLAQDFMNIAIEEAMTTKKNGDVPVGAVIVKNNEIITKCANKVQLLNNSLYHAEMLVIKQAIITLGTKYLTDCDMYVTLEPCSMCAGAILLARIKRLYIGTEDPKTGACGSVINIVQNNNLNHNVETYFGINESKCKFLLTNFFENIREKSQA